MIAAKMHQLQEPRQGSGITISYAGSNQCRKIRVLKQGVASGIAHILIEFVIEKNVDQSGLKPYLRCHRMIGKGLYVLGTPAIRNSKDSFQSALVAGSNPVDIWPVLMS